MSEAEQMMEALRGSPEVSGLLSTLDVYDTAAIASFGADAAQKSSEASDRILRERDSQTDVMPQIHHLRQLMEAFDPSELLKVSSAVARLTGKASADRLLRQYQELSKQLDLCLTSLRTSQEQLTHDLRRLEELQEAALSDYRTLALYTLAAEQGSSELEAYLNANPTLPAAEKATLSHAEEQLGRRKTDLQTSGLVMLQTLSMLTMLMETDQRLTHQLDQAIRISVPVFRQGLEQASALKRRQLTLTAMDGVSRESCRTLVDRLTSAKQEALLALGGE